MEYRTLVERECLGVGGRANGKGSSAPRIIGTNRCAGSTTAHWPPGERIPRVKTTGLSSDSSMSNPGSGPDTKGASRENVCRSVGDLSSSPFGRGSMLGHCYGQVLWTTHQFPQSNTIAARSSSGDSKQDGLMVSVVSLTEVNSNQIELKISRSPALPSPARPPEKVLTVSSRPDLISPEAHRRFWRWAFSLKCAALRAFLPGSICFALCRGSFRESSQRLSLTALRAVQTTVFWLNTGTCSATIWPTSKRQRQKYDPCRT